MTNFLKSHCEMSAEMPCVGLSTTDELEFHEYEWLSLTRIDSQLPFILEWKLDTKGAKVIRLFMYWVFWMQTDILPH